MAGTRVHVVMPAELVERLDAARVRAPTFVSRGEFVRRAVEQALSDAKEPAANERSGPGSVSSSEGVRPAAPAEQSYRSSSFAKRDVRPVPKGGA